MLIVIYKEHLYPGSGISLPDGVKFKQCFIRRFFAIPWVVSGVPQYSVRKVDSRTMLYEIRGLPQSEREF